MSKNPQKKEHHLKKNELIANIIDAQKYVKNEDVFMKIQKKTFENLDQKKEDLKKKQMKMCMRHYLALFCIKTKIYNPDQIKDLSNWIDQECEKKKIQIDTFEAFINFCSENISELINKFNIDKGMIDYIEKTYSFLQKDEMKYLKPEFIYFISKSFRYIFVSSKNTDLAFIKTEMLESWKRNKDYIPSDIRSFFINGKKQDFNQKLRNLFKLIFENPEFYQITYFYQNNLTDKLISDFFKSIDDEYCSEYFTSLKDNKEDSKPDLKQDPQNSLEESRQGFDIFYHNFKNLLISSDLLPAFPESYTSEIHDLEQFISENLVKRGSLRNYKKRFDYFSKMQEFVKRSHKSMNLILSKFDFKAIKFQHDNLKKIINIELKNREKTNNEYMELFNIQKQTSYVLDFNYVNSIVQDYYLQKKNGSKSTAKKPSFISGIINNIFTRKTSENSNENEHKDDETLFNIPEVIKDPIKLNKDYFMFLKKNDEDNKNDKNLFTPDGSLNKENDKEIVYDWKTFLIFSLLKEVTFDKFLENRSEITIFDCSYANMFNAINQIKVNKKNEEEESDDENSDDNDNDNNNEAKVGNIVIDENIIKHYDDLVFELKSAFSSNTNPIQKILDIYNSLKEINNFFAKEGNDLFAQKLNEYGVNKVENAGWSIPFNIFDFVCLPNFVSSMIFIFDYYFLPFERNSKLKMLFLQIYNYAIKKHNSSDQLHFDIISNEDYLYQHLLFCRKHIKMIFVGNNERGQTKNIILKNVLKNSISGKYEENEVFPLDEFISNTKEITCHFFKDSTFYICTFLLLDSVKDLDDFNLKDDKNKNQFAAFLISVDKITDWVEVSNLINILKNNMNITHIISNPAVYPYFIEDYKDNAIIHNLKTFDIKNIKIFN